MQANLNRVYRYTFDMMDTDPYTYAPGQVEGDFKEQIVHTEDTLNQMNVDLAPHMPYSGDSTDTIFKYWRKGACFLDGEGACDKATYVNEVGYTKDLNMNGLEHQLYKFIDTAKIYIREGQVSKELASPAFRLIELMSQTVDDYLYKLIIEFNVYAAESTITATAALFSLATGVFLSFGIYYYIGFSSAADTFSGNNRQLVCLVFAVNQSDRKKSQELNTFVESAGASIN